MPAECETLSRHDLDSSIKVAYSKSYNGCLQVAPNLNRTQFTILHQSPADYLAMALLVLNVPFF